MTEQSIAQRQAGALAKGGVFRTNLVPTEKDRAMALVVAGFDPGLHLAAYQNRVMVNIDGLQWWARRGYRGPDYHGPDDDFRQVTRVLASDERKAYGVAEDEIGVMVTIYAAGDKPGVDPPICEGFGRASTNRQRPVQRGSAVEADHPYLMAVKRARGQAIRQFRPLGFRVQSVEDAIETGLVDTSTGEILEGAARVVPPQPQQDPFEAAPAVSEAPMPAAQAVPPVAKTPAPVKPPVPQTEAEWRTQPASTEMKRAILNAGLAAGLTREKIVSAVNEVSDGNLRCGDGSDLLHKWEEAAKGQKGA